MNIFNFIILIILSSCSYKFPNPSRGTLPTSSLIFGKSTTTNLPVNFPNSFNVDPYRGLNDSKILGYKIQSDTVIKEFFDLRMKDNPYKYHPAELYPGSVWVGGNLLIDEAEVANISWKEFLYYIRNDSVENFYNEMHPMKSELPTEDYFDNSFFLFYPVVGISHQQALEYCIWRTNITSQKLEKYFNAHNTPDSLRFQIKYRLPTKEEWETLASCGLDMDKYPHGLKYVMAKTKVNKHSAQYFKTKNNLSESISTIDKDIKEFNRKKPETIMFNCKKVAPYFLKSQTPNYIYDLPINNFGLYHMIGNVSELVQERGIVKGGSYLENLENCKIKMDLPYKGPAKDIGFRCVCEIIK